MTIMGTNIMNIFCNLKYSMYSNVNKKLLTRIRTFREMRFFMLYVTRIFKSNFVCLTLVTINCEIVCATPTKYGARTKTDSETNQLARN
jgi:hypothetical protein